MAKKLVLACGNTLRGDDGVGWAIAALLEDDPALADVEVVACASTDSGDGGADQPGGDGGLRGLLGGGWGGRGVGVPC